MTESKTRETEAKDQKKKRYKVTPEDVERARCTKGGLMELEVEHGQKTAFVVLRVMEKERLGNYALLKRIIQCQSAETFMVWLARKRMKCQWWRAFVDALINLGPSEWEPVSEAVRDRKLLPIVCTVEGLEYIWKNRLAAVSNPQHPLFEAISFDAHYRRTVIRFLEKNDDGRAWRELVRACRGVPWLDGIGIREDKSAHRCYRASKTTLIVLVSRLFDHLATRKRIGEIRPHERNSPKLPPDLEPQIAGVIDGAYRYDTFRYEDAAVMAIKLDAYYQKRRIAARHRSRAKAAPKKSRSFAHTKAKPERRASSAP